MDSNLEIFKFDDRHIQLGLVRKHNLDKNIKLCFDYLKNHLPINVLDKDNNFDFSTLQFEEGKNYHFFYLVNGKAEILIRQYRTHFTFFTYSKDEDYFKKKLNVFTIHTNTQKMSDKLSDSFCDDEFQTISELLPQLVKLIEENQVQTMWNDLVLVRPEYVEVELAFSGTETVHSLDKLIFACDEIFQMYLCKFAENEMLEKLKTLKVGDKFSSYVIEEIKTEVTDGYYHSAGLKYYNSKFDKKTTWSDVYSLTRYHYDEIFYSDLKSKVNPFLLKNHDVIINELITSERVFMFESAIVNDYIELIRALYNKEFEEIDRPTFFNLVSKEYKNFIYYSYKCKKD
jgi:hypothetical protein